jgi:DHA2 family multidrug resistance protein
MKTSNVQWLVLATVIVGTFLGTIDRTIVNLAIPKMAGDFGITTTLAAWIATAYMIANAVFVPVWGKLGDTIGRKKVYIAGFLIFIIGSVLAGLSWNFSSMIVFRIVQAIASSADIPTAMAIISVTFTDYKKRAQALGIWSSAFASAAVLGPLVGGPLIDLFGWRSVFIINLPIGLIGLAMALAFVHESVSEKKTLNFDWIGATTLGTALASLVLVLEKGQDWGWGSPGSIFLFTATIGFALWFFFHERRHPDPMIDFKFFKNPTFNNALFNNAAVFLAMMGSVFLIPIFAQTFLGMDATHSGYLFIPLAIGFMFSSPIGGRLIGKVRPGIIIAISSFISALGFFLFWVFLDPRSGVLDIILPLFIMSLGMGFGMSQRTSIITNSVPHNEAGMASGILTLGRNIAGAIGIAVFSTLLSTIVNNKLITIASVSQINALSPADYKIAIALMELKAQVSAYGVVYLVCSCIVLLAGLFALLIKMKADMHESKEQVMVME